MILTFINHDTVNENTHILVYILYFSLLWLLGKLNILNILLKNNLIFISVKFSFLAHTIIKLETKNMSINDSM